MNDDPKGSARRRTLVRLTAAAGDVAAAGAAVPFLASLAPSERAEAAGAPVEVDLDAVKPAIKSFLYGALIGVVYVPIYNALQRRFGI